MTTTRDSQALFQRRVWQRRLVAARPLLVGLGLAGLVALVGWIVLFSSLLAVDSVRVSGEHSVHEKQILAAAEVPIGDPLLRVDLGEIEQRVAAMPAVADVSVHRSWPHTVAISIIEREPLAAIQVDGGWWEMDRDGVLFRPTESAADALPVVSLGPKADDAARTEVAAVIASLPPDVLSEVRRLTARTMDSIRLDLSGGKTVIWGSSADSARKVQVLATLLADVQASRYDVSVPEQPTTSR